MLKSILIVRYIINIIMTQAAGGQQKWEALSEATKAEKHVKMVENVVQELGKGVFELLDPHEKCLLQLFIWAGCGCHKDLNTVQSGYVAMESGGKKMMLKALSCLQT